MIRADRTLPHWWRPRGPRWGRPRHAPVDFQNRQTFGASPAGPVSSAVSARAVTSPAPTPPPHMTALEAAPTVNSEAAPLVSPEPEAMPQAQGSWFDGELLPGVKNLYLALGAGALLLVFLVKRKT